MAATSPADLRWVSPADDDTDRTMSNDGLERVRSLFQMRCDLPLTAEVVAATRPVKLRSFDPDTDIDSFLEVNNRAFDWHPEQGGWTKDDLAKPMSEPWFDLNGFLIHDSESNGRIDGFCWTKIHTETSEDPAMGEIFVIGADPAAHGTGLGRALTVGGLDYLAGRGLTIGMLYVEHDNHAAVRLYERLGFSVHHVDAAYSPAPVPADSDDSVAPADAP